MAVAQDAYYIPDDIATGLATGLYRRIGSVVRYATGPNKGQIVKHLKPIDLEDAEKAQSLGAKAFQFAQQHKKGMSITVIAATALGVSWWGYTKFKNREPKALTEFRTLLNTYITAVRNGTMDVEKIDTLMSALDILKTHKNFENIKIQLTAEDFDTLVEHIYQYTIKLAADNNADIVDEIIIPSNSVIVNLYSCLETQKKIFDTAA